MRQKFSTRCRITKLAILPQSCILGAAKAATSISEVEGDSPSPDRHLVKLWKQRDELEEIYIAGGRTYHDLVKIRQQTAKIRRHAKLLARQR
ncbi:hypothetical protein HPB48_007877 [Haemaphysalis longicornis]|uniref:Uncharacterized protein n=1 Tax=Haemaphysalis longicornis TaxID=44386 RepID=A0A9J6FV48_HAELO|nr:hypothetical protein HPB48_007877 [Haemaphysalis longicornis]